MTDKEFFVYTMNDELPRFLRFYDSLPEEKLDYKHTIDPKARTAKEIMCLMACETTTFGDIINKGVVDFSKVDWNSCEGVKIAREKLEKGFQSAVEGAQALSQADWDSTAKMVSGEKTDWETSRGKMARGLLLDLVHHRGQLSTQIRPMGGKVPSIYGPSADIGD